jgi:hypothetical protein
MNVDDQLRDVYAGLASQAPNADRVRAGIAGRVKAQRQRRLLLGVGGTAAAVAAVGVPALLLREELPPVDASLRPIRGRGYPMPFTPSWIPEGFMLTERRITIGVPGPQRRVWQSDPSMMFPELRVDLLLTDGTIPAPSSNVDLDGVPASVHHEKHLASCSWQAMAGLRVSVVLQKQPDEIDSGPEYAQIVQRVARSALRGKVEYLLPTMSFGWLPDQQPLQRSFRRFYGTEGQGGEQLADVILASAADVGTVIWATVVDRLDLLPDINLAAMEKTTVRYRPAWYTPPHPQGVYQGGGHFVVELAGGRWLSAAGDSNEKFTITKAELIRVIDTVQIG